MRHACTSDDNRSGARGVLAARPDTFQYHCSLKAAIWKHVCSSVSQSNCEQLHNGFLHNCRVQQLPLQPTVTPPALEVCDSASPADIELSLVSADTALPQRPADADALNGAQSPTDSLASGSRAGQLRDASNQQLPAGSALIKAGVKTTSSMAVSGDQDAVKGISQHKVTGSSHRVAFDESSGALASAQDQSKAPAEDWTVIQSDGSDSEFASKPGAKLGLVRVKSEVPQAELSWEQQGLFQAGQPNSEPQRSTSSGAKLQSGNSIQLLRRKLPALKVPLTGMGRPRATGRVATPRFVAEGYGCGSCPKHSAISDSCSHGQAVLDIYLQAQPDQCQEEEAARALSQHLSNNLGHVLQSSAAAPQQLLCEDASCVHDYPFIAQHSNSQSHWLSPQPVAEGRESIAAFHPSWHLRLNQTARSQPQPEQQAAANGQEDDSDESLDLFYRPAGGAVKPPQHQPSMVEEAGCLNFGSHLVSHEQLPEKRPPRQASQRQRSAIDDAALSSEEEEGEYEEGAGAEPLSRAESEPEWQDDSGLVRDKDGSRDNAAEVIFNHVLSQQGRFEEGQYADYRSEEGLSEEEQYPDPSIDREGLDQLLDVLPAGITTNTEVYSPMSHGATRVRSMITNRPFLIEEPISPVAKRLGDTMQLGPQVTFDIQADAPHDSAPMHPPPIQEETFYHDWSQPSASFLAAANAEAAAAAEAEAAEAAAAEEAAQQAAARIPLSDPNTVKAPRAGAVTRLADTLFRRSGKRTAETQTTEYREEETQTSDLTESQQQQAGSQQMGLVSGASSQPKALCKLAH